MPWSCSASPAWTRPCAPRQLRLPSGPAACELIDRRLLRLARGSDADVAALDPAAAEAVLLVEYEADSPRRGRAGRRTTWPTAVTATERLALLALAACDPAEIDRFWQLREAALPSLYGLRGGRSRCRSSRTSACPPKTLPAYLHRVQEVLQQHETTASFLIHAGTGQVHMRPFLDLQRPEDVASCGRWPRRSTRLVLELGGTISTQHGTGLARTPWVSRQYGPLYPVFRELKAIFDPRHLFNPGKIVGPTPGLPTWPLRSGDAVQSRHLERDEPDASAALQRRRRAPRTGLATRAAAALAARRDRRGSCSCNGCGQCRTDGAGPAHVPDLPRHPRRGGHAAGQGQPAAPPARAGRRSARLARPTRCARWPTCASIARCAPVECPAHVNIPKLMLEAKAANVAEHGLDRTDWVLARTEMFARLGSAFAPLVNALLASRVARWLLEKLFGLSRQRRLPASPRAAFCAAPGGAAGRASRARPGRASPTSWTSSPTTTIR